MKLIDVLNNLAAERVADADRADEYGVLCDAVRILRDLEAANRREKIDAFLRSLGLSPEAAYKFEEAIMHVLNGGEVEISDWMK